MAKRLGSSGEHIDRDDRAKDGKEETLANDQQPSGNDRERHRHEQDVEAGVSAQRRREPAKGMDFVPAGD